MGIKRAVLPHMHRVIRHLSDGRCHIHVYAYRGRGAPRLATYTGADLQGARQAELAGVDDLVKAYAASRVAGQKPTKTIHDLVVLYRGDPDGLPKLATSTRAQWSRWLDVIDKQFGSLELRLLKAAAARNAIKRWRNSMAETPRKADYGIQVLRRVLAFGMEEGLVENNPATSFKKLHNVNRAEQIVTDDELEAILSKATIRARHVIGLAAATGLRRGDLVDLKWDQVRDDFLIVKTNKSGGRVTATVPLTPAARAIIEQLTQERREVIASGAIPSAFVLTTERGGKWLPASVTQAFIRAAAAAGVAKRLHDLRGTAATRLLLAGCTTFEVATIMGWEEKGVERILLRYVDPGAIARRAAERLARNETAG
ncbi:integrase [Brevundimonas sp. 1080]|uniref:tyrosine-type recombinase/integrase n=1 Tax=Brevundimonas sp. 1080 TaxID=3156405 RepID=UPI003397E394